MRFRPRTSNSGCCSGSCTVSKISFLTCCRPPTSSQRTSGICSQRYYSHIYSDTYPQGQQASIYITLGAPTAVAWTSCSVCNATVKSGFKRVTPLLHSSFCCPPLDKHIQNQQQQSPFHDHINAKVIRVKCKQTLTSFARVSDRQIYPLPPQELPDPPKQTPDKKQPQNQSSQIQIQWFTAAVVEPLQKTSMLLCCHPPSGRGLFCDLTRNKGSCLLAPQSC